MGLFLICEGLYEGFGIGKTEKWQGLNRHGIYYTGCLGHVYLVCIVFWYIILYYDSCS